MTYLGVTKEGTEIYREAMGHLSKSVTYRTERRNGQIRSIDVGLPKSAIKEIIRKERLEKPLTEILE